MGSWTIGVDLGGTNTVLGLVGPDGRLRAREDFSTRAHPEAGDWCDRLADGVRGLASVADGPLTGIGIGAPNGNHYRGTVEHAANLSWRGVVPLAREVESRCGLPVVLDNDANVAALGELEHGAGRGHRHLIVATLGTGVGGGIVVDGALLRGANGFGGELGHMTVIPRGRRCNCGGRGCLETYASVSGLLITVRAGLEVSAPGYEDFEGVELDGAAIDRFARKGNPLAQEAFDLAASTLAQALASAVALLAPSRIILFGGMAAASDLLLDPLRRRLDAQLLRIHRGEVDVVPSGLPAGDAALLGAALLVARAQEGM